MRCAGRDLGLLAAALYRLGSDVVCQKVTIFVTHCLCLWLYVQSNRARKVSGCFRLVKAKFLHSVTQGTQ
jgi:hypothetical protein